MTRIEEDMVLAGNVKVLGTFTMPDETITDAKVIAAAGIKASKLEHQHRVPYNQPNSAAATDTRVIYTCYGATARVIALKVGSIAIAVGAATVTVDVQKMDGTSILASGTPVTLNSSNVAGVPVTATLGLTAVLAQVANGSLKIIVVATAGGGTLPTGVFASLTVEEDAR